MDRVTFGWTPEEDTKLRTMGWFNYLLEQFDYSSIPDTDAIQLLNDKAPTWNMTVADAYTYLPAGQPVSQPDGLGTGPHTQGWRADQRTDQPASQTGDRLTHTQSWRANERTDQRASRH